MGITEMDDKFLYEVVEVHWTEDDEDDVNVPPLMPDNQTQQ
jgi:hypothetical protein